MKYFGSKQIIGILGIGISILAFYFIFQKIDFVDVYEHLRKISPIEIIAIVLVYLSTFIFRVLRWKWMLRSYPDIPYSTFFKSMILGFAGNNIIPARGGELVRMQMFSSLTKISRVTSLASVLTERILDGLSILLVLLFATYFFAPDLVHIPWFSKVLIFGSMIFVGALLALISIRLLGPFIKSLLTKYLGDLGVKLTGIIDNINGSLDFLKADFNSVKIIISSACIWITEVMVYMIALHACEVEGDIITMAFIALPIVNFGILIPSSPGYLGVFQYFTVLGLSLFGVDQPHALSVSFLIHSSQFIPVTLIGLFVFVRYSYKSIKK